MYQACVKDLVVAWSTLPLENGRNSKLVSESVGIFMLVLLKAAAASTTVFLICMIFACGDLFGGFCIPHY